MPPLFWVDAFTELPFAGNPAAVCLLDRPADETWMQQIATEIGLSETAFLVAKDGGFGLRWFTPKAEVDLCGHATLASAHVLWETGVSDRRSAIRFHTLSGLLTASLEASWITLDFPAEPPLPIPVPAGLSESLGLPVQECFANRLDRFVVLADEKRLRALQPDFERMTQLEARGVIVTSASESPEFDFISRFFAPSVGVPEDPVTGSAHCALGPFWAQRLGKQQLTGFQASSRGGIVRIHVQEKRVLLSGRAVTVLQGALSSKAASV